MSNREGITDQAIQEVTEMFVEIANLDGSIEAIFESYKDNRSLAIEVADSRFKTGFIMQAGKIRMLSSLDKPTVKIAMLKPTYWAIINAGSVAESRAMIYRGVFTDESILFDPPPGVDGGMLHLENLMQVFSFIAEKVVPDA